MDLGSRDLMDAGDLGYGRDREKKRSVVDFVLRGLS